MLRTGFGRAFLTATVAVVAVALGVFLLAGREGGDESAADVVGTGGAELVRADSHRLDDPPDADVTLVEFLDFECEGCRAAYPLVEELRAEYGDRVEFVVRYFPMSGHVNAERAARAVEAAAQQGRLEDMYRAMFETQPQWGEQRTPADDVFRGMATELGLDMVAYDAAYDDAATVERVRLDKRDGEELGVRGTPTFFVNGDQVQLRSRADLRAAVDRALAGDAPANP